MTRLINPALFFNKFELFDMKSQEYINVRS